VDGIMLALLAFSPGFSTPGFSTTGFSTTGHITTGHNAPWSMRAPSTAIPRAARVVAFEGGSRPRSDEEITAIFREFDTSGDGFIDLGELQSALVKAGKPVSRAEAQQILEVVDENSDGQISLPEFKEVFKLAPSNVPDVLKGLADVLDLFSLQGLFSDLGVGGQWRRTEAGAKYVDDVIGPGKLVVPGDYVQMHFTVTALTTNGVVETSRKGSGRPLGYPVGEADGTRVSWDDCLAGMRIGGSRRVYVGQVEGEEPTLRYDLELVALESESYAKREELVARLGGRRAITRALFALTFVPYFVPETSLPPVLNAWFHPEAIEAEEVREAKSDLDAKVSRQDQYVAKSLDALFPPTK